MEIFLKLVPLNWFRTHVPRGVPYLTRVLAGEAAAINSIGLTLALPNGNSFADLLKEYPDIVDATPVHEVEHHRYKRASSLL